jgi:polar amino acid transport system substrate-binding protein
MLGMFIAISWVFNSYVRMMQWRLRWRRFALLCAAVLFATGLLSAHTARASRVDRAVGRAAAQDGPLRVAIKPIAPFVMKRDDRAVGFSIDYWDQIAKRLNRTTEYVMLDTVGAVIESVKNGEADVGIAAISMTAEREQVIDFTHGYYESGLQVLVTTESSSVLDNVFATIFSRDMLQLLLIIGAITLLFTHIIWLVERSTNSRYPRGYREGISAALWWTVVTLATVGDSEGTPRHRIGKLLAILWMFISIILIANFTAVVTSTATLRDLRGTIQGADDLPGKTIATVKNTTSARYLADNGLSFTPVDNIEAAFALLRAKQVQAVIYDSPVLLYHAAHDGRGYEEVVGAAFQKEQYGIALSNGNPLREEINRLILQFQKDGTYDAISSKWFRDGQ